MSPFFLQWPNIMGYQECNKGQTAEARRTTVLQLVEQKPHSQKNRQDEKAEGYVPDEGTRKNPRKTTK